jgi:outer membrane protein assembly factor BamA
MPVNVLLLLLALEVRASDAVAQPVPVPLPDALEEPASVGTAEAYSDEGEGLVEDIPGAGETPRYVVERVELRGNWRTADAVILGRMDLRSGEALAEERVAVSRLRLMATGYFRDVTVKLERGSQRGRVVVVVLIEERIPIPLVEGLYLGFSQVTPLFAGVSLVDTNYLGRGVIVGFGGIWSPRQQAVRARLVDPSLWRSPLGARARLVLTNGLEPIALGSSATAGGTLKYTRMGGGAGAMLTEGWVGRFAIDYRFELLHAALALVPGAARPPRMLPGWSRLSTLALSFERDTRDRAFVPTDGTLLRFSAEGASAIILSDYEFAKFRAGYEAQVPLKSLWRLLGDHALSVRLDAGYVQQGLPFLGESGAPFFDEFYVGDTSYFRFQRNSLPRQMGLNLAPFNEYGDVLISFGSEYDFPLYTTGATLLYRAYIYAAFDVTEVTRARDVASRRLRGRLLLDHFTPTFDVGLKLDTLLGTFTFSGSYMVDLVL